METVGYSLFLVSMQKHITDNQSLFLYISSATLTENSFYETL